VELLRQSAADGSVDLKHLETDEDLKSLRDRPDFRQLLDKLRAKSPKKP
jgi:hypothetical protein